MRDPLAQFEPRPDRPWDRAAAGHLLRRAGFQPSEPEARRALEDGPRETVRRLVHGTEESSRHNELDALSARFARGRDVSNLRAWWLSRMRYTDRPLHARMAMFWHNHFATSNAKVQSPVMMLAQLRAFEAHGLGRFRDLVVAIARDPAMIVWLDGNLNINGRANENFARELFELFTLGVGHYTEDDIKEAARAFTGWHAKRGRFYFSKHAHDTGAKRVLGVSGPLSGEDVIDAALAQPACAEFIARKLCVEFVSAAPPVDLVNVLAERLRSTRYDLGDAVSTLLSSEAMFDPSHYRARIKSPVEFAVGLARSLDLNAPGPALANAASAAGQRLFEPPSVNGWEGGRSWLNTTTMLLRLSQSQRALGAGAFNAGAVISRERLRTTPAIAEFCERVALDGRAPSAVRDELRSLPADREDALREGLRIVLTAPEYQLA